MPTNATRASMSYDRLVIHQARDLPYCAVQEASPVTIIADKSSLRTQLKRKRALAHAQLPKAGEALASRVPTQWLNAVRDGLPIACAPNTEAPAPSRLTAVEPSPEAAPTQPKHPIIAGYVPKGDEMPTGEILGLFRHCGARLALPVVQYPVGGGDQPLIFRSFDFGQPLIRGEFGIPVPDDEATQLVPDMVLVPLLGWSHDGARLGYGGGYYDATLAALRARGHVIAVGLAFEAQRVWDLPRQGHDQPLDWVITESAAYRTVG